MKATSTPKTHMITRIILSYTVSVHLIFRGKVKLTSHSYWDNDPLSCSSLLDLRNQEDSGNLSACFCINRCKRRKARRADSTSCSSAKRLASEAMR